jgi:hypothetical protein
MATCESNDNDVGRMEKRAKAANKMCIKCKSVKPGALIKNLVYCKDCLQALVVQKFKKSIDETINNDTAPSSILAIAFSGGLGSTLLLELVAGTLCASSHRRSRRHRWDSIHIIYIDDSKALSMIDKDSRPAINVQSILEKYPDYHLTKVPIENAFSSSSNDGKLPPHVHNVDSILKQLLQLRLSALT